jgi:ferritin
MSKEMYNHFLYLSIANYFSTSGILDLEEYYRKRADEERVHFMWIFDYLTDQDYELTVPAVEAIKEKINEDRDAFVITVQKEIETSDSIDKIYSLALEEKDNFTRQWLDRLLIIEQVEEESTSRTALEIFDLDDPILDRAKRILKLLK